MPTESESSAPAASMTPRVFCKGCGYALVGLASSKCPECGGGLIWPIGGRSPGDHRAGGSGGGAAGFGGGAFVAAGGGGGDGVVVVGMAGGAKDDCAADPAV